MTSNARVTAAVAVMLLALFAAACGDVPRQTDTAAQSTAATSDDGASIYALDLPLVEASGRTVHLGDLRGRPLIAAMMYTSCTSVCPRVTEDMKTIERQLREHGLGGATFVLFSLDGERDTPEALQRFATTHQLGASHWRLFAASEDGQRDLAAVLGVKYRPEPDGEIAHSAMIVLIDRNGVVRHRQLGLVNDQRDLVARFASLDAEDRR